jgi:peptidoglycan/xylan/chitin deacetylase (PgdA/CDA1 family)
VSRLAVITYHSLDDSRSVISVDPATFRRHVGWLADHGFAAFTLSDGLARLGAGTLPERALALTFDDGFLNTASVALPILTTHGFLASVFLVADYLGRSNDWPAQSSGVPRLPLMDWAAVEELRAAGWEVGAHTRTHSDLTRLPTDKVRAEVAGSRACLEHQLGAAVPVFAYPYGRYAARERAIVGQTFRAAVATRLGLARRDSDELALERLDAYYLTRPDLIRFLDSRLLTPYLSLRQAARRLARRN